MTTTDLGTVTTRDGVSELRYERRLAHPVERVWAAVTEPAEMIRWWCDADVDPNEGGKVELRWVNAKDGGVATVARGVVTAWDAPRVVEYDTDVHGRLRFELSPDGPVTLLVFTVTIEIPADALLKNLAGWHVHLEHLEHTLGGQPDIDWPHWYRDHFPRWQELHAVYAGT
jgi:uncharacterized protein YndB with AHSA1/START domain